MLRLLRDNFLDAKESPCFMNIVLFDTNIIGLVGTSGLYSFGYKE
jgi:hypothetical protein